MFKCFLSFSSPLKIQLSTFYVDCTWPSLQNVVQREPDVVYNQLLLTQTILQLSKCCPFTPLSCCMWEELSLAPAVLHRCPFTGSSPASPSSQPSSASGHGYTLYSVTYWACDASSWNPLGSHGKSQAPLLGYTLDLPTWCFMNQGCMINYRKMRCVSQSSLASLLKEKHSYILPYVPATTRSPGGMAQMMLLHLWPGAPHPPRCPQDAS